MQPKQEGSKAEVTKTSDRDNKRARKIRSNTMTTAHRTVQRDRAEEQHDSMKWKLSNPIVIPNWPDAQSGRRNLGSNGTV